MAGRYASLNAYFNACIEHHLFPGCAIGIIAHGERRIITAGRLTYDRLSPPVTEETVYDVASITKAIPTSCLALALCDDGVWSFTSRLIDFIPEFTGAFRESITIRHLLTHTLDFDFQLSAKKHLPPDAIIGTILSASLRTPPGSRFAYANATSILLGLAVERASGMRLDEAAHYRFFAPLAMTRTSFFPETRSGAFIAPTEEDSWRGRIICGEVHDESAWALRPSVVAGSAGLFSTAPDLLKFIEMLLVGGEINDRRFFARETVALMHTNALPPALGASAALGWELNQPVFMGTTATPTTFGKTGFTGCAIVADPGRRTGMVFLTNHTFPKRRGDRNAINTVRSTLADMIFGKLSK
jgi:CubicO group peptidase (beta-lactamase class C family)